MPGRSQMTPRFWGGIEKVLDCSWAVATATGPNGFEVISGSLARDLGLLSRGFRFLLG